MPFCLPRCIAASAVLLCASFPSYAQQNTPARDLLMPRPASIQLAADGLHVQAGLTVALAQSHSPRLQAATLRFLKRMEDKTGMPLARSIGSGRTGTFVLEVASDGQAVQGPEEDESYSLEVTATGLHLKAATTVGALHGMETIYQLTQPAGSGYVIQAATVQDSPRFQWRGLMIDCARHFEPMDVLKRNLDAMAAVKLNVFHWHLIDDQGFRIESKVEPKLTELGSDGKFYTQADARELVQYARDRGIRVVPEFEMPGHSAAWLVAYPELNSGTQPDGIRREFGISDSALDPTREETYKFIQRFLTEMATVFPDPYIHIGGDETPAPDWKKNPRILQFMKAHNLKDKEALQAYFNTRVLTMLTKLNRKMVGWDEILNPDLPKNIVIQSWRGEASLAAGAQQGFQGVLSAPYYLDAMKTSGLMYLADPIPADTKLTPAQQSLILGGEVCMWAEQLDEHTVDSRVWPRTAALAERFWSAQNVRDVDDMYRRLAPTSLELETFGVRHLSTEDAGLRSLAGTEQIDALRTFARAFEPVPFGNRYQEQHTSQLTPLTGFVDAVVPDPPVKHKLEEAVAVLTKQGAAASASGAADQLTAYFRAVGGSVPQVEAMFPAAPRLQPMAQRAQQLQALSQIGIQAVQYLTSHQAAPANWKADSLAQLQAAKKPSAIVRFVFQDSLTRLVQAVQ